MNISINFSEINWISVLVVTLLSFVLGALWHSSKLFGKAWAEDAKPEIDKSNKSSILKLFGFSAVAHFVGVTALDVFIGTEATALVGLIKGLIVGIVWVSGSIAVTHLFVGRSLRLILIDAGFYVVFYAIAGTILGAW